MPTAALRPLRWENPPPTRGGRPAGSRDSRADRHVELAAELRANPRRWAVVAEYGPPNGTLHDSAKNLVRAIQTGQPTSWAPAGAFEATTRRQGHITAVYARYIGTEQ